MMEKIEKIERGILAVINNTDADGATTFILSLLQQHAVEFAEWQKKEELKGYIEWRSWHTVGALWKVNSKAPYSSSDYDIITTTELYDIYLKEVENGK
jgi:hypothetical protein